MTRSGRSRSAGRAHRALRGRATPRPRRHGRRVWCATPLINRQAALKTIRVDTDLDAKQIIEMRQRFYREGQPPAAHHPNIVTVYDVGEDLGMSYIVMEFVEGQTLAQWMKKQRFNLAQIKHVIYNAGLASTTPTRTASSIATSSPKLCSRRRRVKVMDFGIARIAESNLTKTGSVMGTPAYMSPEQVSGQRSTPGATSSRSA